MAEIEFQPPARRRRERSLPPGMTDEMQRENANLKSRTPKQHLDVLAQELLSLEPQAHRAQVLFKLFMHHGGPSYVGELFRRAGPVHDIGRVVSRRPTSRIPVAVQAAVVPLEEESRSFSTIVSSAIRHVTQRGGPLPEKQTQEPPDLKRRINDYVQRRRDFDRPVGEYDSDVHKHPRLGRLLRLHDVSLVDVQRGLAHLDEPSSAKFFRLHEAGFSSAQIARLLTHDPSVEKKESGQRGLPKVTSLLLERFTEPAVVEALAKNGHDWDSISGSLQLNGLNDRAIIGLKDAYLRALS